MSANELEQIEDGLNSEFWRLFSEHVQREWSPAGLRFQQAVQAASTDPNGMIELQKVLATQANILTLMRWPQERMSTLRKQQTGEGFTVMSRRGPGL